MVVILSPVAPASSHSSGAIASHAALDPRERDPRRAAPRRSRCSTRSTSSSSGRPRSMRSAAGPAGDPAAPRVEGRPAVSDPPHVDDRRRAPHRQAKDPARQVPPLGDPNGEVHLAWQACSGRSTTPAHPRPDADWPSSSSTSCTPAPSPSSPGSAGPYGSGVSRSWPTSPPAASRTTGYASCSPPTEPGPTGDGLPMLDSEEPVSAPPGQRRASAVSPRLVAGRRG